jgi:hypothetical protein
VLLVALSLDGSEAGPISVSDSEGNAYRQVGEVDDVYWHRTALFAAFDAKPLSTADQIESTYPRSSKYHIAIDEFSGLHEAGSVATGSNLWGADTASFSTSAHPIQCAAGDVLIAVVATNTGPAPQFTAGWQALPILKLSSYRQTVAYDFVTAPGRCAATGSTTAQWEALAVIFHR